MCPSWYSSSFRVSRIRLNCNCHWIADDSNFGSAIPILWKPSTVPSHRVSPTIFRSMRFCPSGRLLSTVGPLKTLGCSTASHHIEIIQHHKSPPDAHLESTKASAFNISLEVIGATCPKRALRIWQPSWGLGYGILLGNFEWLYLHTVFVCCLHSIRTRKRCT